MSNPRKLTERLCLNLAPADLDRLSALAERLPMATPHSLAREALRVGLTTLEADPGRMLAPRALSSVEVKS